MPRMYDNLAIAPAIVASLGCVSACFYMVYHSAMIAISTTVIRRQSSEHVLPHLPYSSEYGEVASPKSN